MVSVLAEPIVQLDIETPGHGDHQLVKRLVAMTSSGCASRNVVEVVEAFDLDRDVAMGFDECEIPAGIRNLREFYDFAVFEAHLIVTDFKFVKIVDDGPGAETLLVLDQSDVKIAAILLGRDTEM